MGFSYRAIRGQELAMQIVKLTKTSGTAGLTILEALELNMKFILLESVVELCRCGSDSYYFLQIHTMTDHFTPTRVSSKQSYRQQTGST